MTYAPKRLLELRSYLMGQTGITDFRAMGIVGNEAHDGGYHHGWDDRRIRNGQTSDYSWNESARDNSHRTNAAAAIDIGMFARLRELNKWLVGQCEAQAPDTQDIRSIIYSPDGQTVKRWDRLGKRSTGDSSHLTHTHVSYFRDAEDRDKTGPFRRFFEGNTVTQTDIHVEYMSWRVECLAHGLSVMRGGPEQGKANWTVQTLKEILTEVQAISGPSPVDIGALMAALEPRLAEMVEKATEQAVRRVLGGLDGATPPPPPGG
jgi:hypothetical protein